MIGNNSVGEFNEMLENTSHLAISAKDLTHELAMKVMPVTGLILTLACLGLFGNILILIVYSKYYRMSNFRYFVLCLAYIDLLSCVTTLPAEAHTQVNWFTFRFDALCKIKSFLNVFTIFASALTFLFLACDRYNKICHPFSRQIEPPLAWRLCVVSVIVSAVMASPAAVFWGTQTFIISSGNTSTSVKICEKSDFFADRLYPLVYIVTAFSLPVCIVMLLTGFCNIMIVRKLVHGNSALRQTEGQHLETGGYKADGSGLQTVSEGGQTANPEKLQNGSKHSFKFWRHHSFPALKLSSRKKIYYCDRCNKTGSSYAGSVLQENALNEIGHNGSVTNGTHNERTEFNGTYHHICHKGQVLNEHMHYSVKSNSIGKPFVFKTVRNGKRKRNETSLKHSLYLKRHDSSTTGDIQSIYEKNASQTTGRRTSHLSEMDITKADSITLQGLHRWKVWREQALMRKAMNSRRKTLIMMILSSVFILTMVIYFTLVILVADVDGIFRNMSTSKTAVFFFFWRLYFINTVINPILYGLLDQRFRKGLAKLCCNRRLYR